MVRIKKSFFKNSLWELLLSGRYAPPSPTPYSTVWLSGHLHSDPGWHCSFSGLAVLHFPTSSQSISETPGSSTGPGTRMPAVNAWTRRTAMFCSLGEVASPRAGDQYHVFCWMDPPQLDAKQEQSWGFQRLSPALDPASIGWKRPLIDPASHPGKDHLMSGLGNKQLKPRVVFSSSWLCRVPTAQLLPLGPKTSCENLIYRTHLSTLCLFDCSSVLDIRFCTSQWQSTYLIFCSVPSLASGTQLNYTHLCCFKKISKRRTECNLEIIKNADSGYKQTQIQVLTTLLTGCVIIDEFLSFLGSIFLFLKCNVCLEGLTWEWGCEYMCVCVFKRHRTFLEFVFQLRGVSSIPSQGAKIPQAEKPKHKAEAILRQIQ